MIYQPMPIGRVCRKCGQWKPYCELRKNNEAPDGVRNLCLACCNLYNKLLYKRDPEQFRKREARYRETHPNANRDRKKRSYAADKAKHRIGVDRWAKNNPDKRRAIKRKSQHRRNAKQKVLPATFTLDDWRRCLAYWHDRCAYCGRPQGLWHTLAQDHFVPVSKGGGYTPGNILPACHGVDGCNNAKFDSDPVEWLLKRFGKKQSKAKFNEIQIYFALAVKTHHDDAPLIDP